MEALLGLSAYAHYYAYGTFSFVQFPSLGLRNRISKWDWLLNHYYFPFSSPTFGHNSSPLVTPNQTRRSHMLSLGSYTHAQLRLCALRLHMLIIHTACLKHMLMGTYAPFLGICSTAYAQTP